MFALPISKPRFKAMVFIKIGLKLSLSSKKYKILQGLGALPPDLEWIWLGALQSDPQNSPSLQISC